MNVSREQEVELQEFQNQQQQQQQQQQLQQDQQQSHQDDSSTSGVGSPPISQESASSSNSPTQHQDLIEEDFQKLELQDNDTPIPPAKKYFPNSLIHSRNDIPINLSSENIVKRDDPDVESNQPISNNNDQQNNNASSNNNNQQNHSTSIFIKLRGWWWHRGISFYIMLFYIAFNIGIGAHTFYNMYNHNEIGREFLGLSFCFSRTAARLINLNSAVILLPVLRNFLSWLRGTWVNNYIPIDKHLNLHKLCAFMLFCCTIIHCVGHYVSFRKINLDIEKMNNNDPNDPSVAGNYLNVDISKFPDEKYLFFKSVPGITGHLMLLIFLIMFSASMYKIRRPMFELFWYTHHLFIPYYILLCFHGYSKILKRDPQSWMWIIGPFIFYATERIIRIARGKKTVVVEKAIMHPSKVLELQMRRDGFNFKPGQYLYLNCPAIAYHEYHPFTITSAPDDEYISVHINIVGNWTRKLFRLLNPDNKLGLVQEDLTKTQKRGKRPILKIDGPFGAPSENFFKYQNLVLVGAGIGVTPFASILKHLKNQNDKQNNSDEEHMRIKKIYFIWVSREKNSFQWFTDVLAELENDERIDRVLEIHIFLTGKLSLDDYAKIKNTENSNCHITSLRTKTLFGRPNFKSIFRQISTFHAKEKVGVFYCGNKALGKNLSKNCNKFNGKNGCHIVFFKENF